MTPVEWGLLLFLSVLWGGSFFFVGVAVREIPPFTLVLLRVMTGAGVLLLIVRLMGQRIPSESHIWAWFSWQCRAVQPACLGAIAHPERPRLDPQRSDAARDDPRCACPDNRREDDGRAARRFYRILAVAGATRFALVTFLVPISAILLGWLVLDEHLALRHFLGMAMIGLGLASVDGHLGAVLRRLCPA